MVTWRHHELFGATLKVHGWQHMEGQLHLRVTLCDGSRGLLPAAWTDLLDNQLDGDSELLFGAAAVRALRAVLEPLQGRRKRPRRRPDASRLTPQ